MADAEAISPRAIKSILGVLRTAIADEPRFRPLDYAVSVQRSKLLPGWRAQVVEWVLDVSAPSRRRRQY